MKDKILPFTIFQIPSKIMYLILNPFLNLRYPISSLFSICALLLIFPLSLLRIIPKRKPTWPWSSCGLSWWNFRAMTFLRCSLHMAHSYPQWFISFYFILFLIIPRPPTGVRIEPLKTWHDVINMWIFIIYLIKFHFTFIYPISLYYIL